MSRAFPDGFDPYAVLGVRRGATADEVKRARRRRARELHPDVCRNSASALEGMKLVNLAADTLLRGDWCPVAGAGSSGSRQHAPSRTPWTPPPRDDTYEPWAPPTAARSRWDFVVGWAPILVWLGLMIVIPTIIGLAIGSDGAPSARFQQPRWNPPYVPPPPVWQPPIPTVSPPQYPYEYAESPRRAARLDYPRGRDSVWADQWRLDDAGRDWASFGAKPATHDLDLADLLAEIERTTADLTKSRERTVTREVGPPPGGHVSR